MKKKLIITNNQYVKLRQHINENKIYEDNVNDIVKFLEANYNKVLEKYREGNEYKNKKAFEVKADGDIITPRDLMIYLKSKFNVGEGFIKQLLDDWCNGTINNGRLSKNTSLSD